MISTIKASKIFGEIDSNFTTNICENFFSIKSKLVPKNRFFGASSKSRLEIAILEHENPYLWFLEFIQFCNENHHPLLELHPTIVDHLKEQRKLVDNNRKYKSQERIKNEEAFCKFLRRKSCLIEASTDDMGHEKGILLAKAKNSPFCQALINKIYYDVEIKAAKKECDLIESITKKIASKEKKLQTLTSNIEKNQELTTQINNLRANLHEINNEFQKREQNIQETAKKAFYDKKQKQKEYEKSRKKREKQPKRKEGKNNLID